MTSIVTRTLMAAGIVLALFVAFSPVARPPADGDAAGGEAVRAAPNPADLVAARPAEAQQAAQQPSQEPAPDPERVARGAYLVNIGGCNDCHTPWVMDQKTGQPAPDMSRMLSGHPQGAPEPPEVQGKAPYAAVIGATMTAFRAPFGVVYSPNLTPDPETGIGQWTEQQFITALRSGLHAGKDDGRPILPPMPWQNLANATDDDLSAIYVFLRTLPPMKNAVPAPKVPKKVLDQMKVAYGKASRVEE